MSIVCPIPSNAQNLLNNPESVVWDAPRNRYLVSNWGDGAIVEMDEGGAQTYFSTLLQNQFQLAALHIHGDMLLVAGGNAPGAGIFFFDLETDTFLFSIPLPGVGLPNDIVVDTDGFIYVTDYWDPKLYVIRNYIPSVFVQTNLPNPNGMTYDQLNDRLLIVCVTGGASPIKAVAIADSSVSTVVTTPFPGMDGIVMDSYRRLYVSEWTTDRVHRYPATLTGPPEVFSSVHSDPADIYYDVAHEQIAVPSFGTNTVEFVPVDAMSVQAVAGPRPQRIVLHQNQPNPFNPATTIRYDLTEDTDVRLAIYSTTGRLITTLFEGRQTAGSRTAFWNGTDAAGLPVGSGVYVYSIETGGDEASRQSRKMLLAR
jgi:hypothetical protein